jgi:hypothetical protein
LSAIYLLMSAGGQVVSRCIKPASSSKNRSIPPGDTNAKNVGR